MPNDSQVVEFELQGFSTGLRLRGLLFPLFLALYGLALGGNALIMVTIGLSAALHTPMYFFLVNLSLLDVACASTVVPKLLVMLAGGAASISYLGCMTQMFFLSWTVASEVLLFTAMALDRYVAICCPLHYGALMRPTVCGALATGVWALGGLGSGVNTGLMLRLTFCGPSPRVVEHFFCEIPPLLRLACSSTHLNDVMAVVADFFFAVLNFLLTMASYTCVIAAVLRMRSAEGRRRAFSTCSSHLLVVGLYYSTVIYTYLSPGSRYSPGPGRVLAVLYSVVNPALNPLIYSLRNKDVKAALRRVCALLAQNL